MKFKHKFGVLYFYLLNLATPAPVLWVLLPGSLQYKEKN